MGRCKAFTREGKPCQNFVGKGKKLYCARHSAGTSQAGRTRQKQNRSLAIASAAPTGRRFNIQRGG